MIANMLTNNKDLGYSKNNDKFLSKTKENSFRLLWTISKIEEELVFHLSSYCDTEIKEDASRINNNIKEIVIKHPYQEQAKSILYKINLANRPLVFNIYNNTFSPKLKEELNHLYKTNKEVFNEIVTNSVKRLYESIDYQYFHMNGIGGKIVWTII